MPAQVHQSHIMVKKKKKKPHPNNKLIIKKGFSIPIISSAPHETIIIL